MFGYFGYKIGCKFGFKFRGQFNIKKKYSIEIYIPTPFSIVPGRNYARRRYVELVQKPIVPARNYEYGYFFLYINFLIS